MANETTSAEQLLINKYKAEAIQLQGKLKDLEQETKDVIAGSTEEAEKLLEKLKAEEAIKLRTLEIERLNLIEKQKSGDATQEQIDKIEELNSLIEEQRLSSLKAIKDQEKRITLLQKEDDHQKKIRTNVLGIVKAEEQRRVKLTEVWAETQKLSSADIMATFTARAQEQSALIFALAVNLNSVSANLNKLTNTTGQFDSMLADVSATNIRFGVSAENAAAAIGDLYTEFSQFSSLNKETQQELTVFTAKMEKAGISSQTTAKFLNVASKSMGMGTKEIIKYQKELFAFAKANNISTKAINDGLASVMPRLAAFGKEGPRIFKELAFQAKQMGTEMDKLLGVTEKFTTFEGAAEAAGELNSVLGGNYIDSLELLRAASDDPVKATNMLRDALQATGKSFEQLSGQQRRLFADILGTDLETTAGYFNQIGSEAKAAADAEKTFNDTIAAFVPIGDKLKNLFNAISPAVMVLAEGFGYVVDILASFVQLAPVRYLLMIAAGFAVLVGGISILVGFLGTLVGSFGMLWKLLKSAPSLFGGVKDAVENMGDTASSLVEKATETLKNASSSIGGFLKNIAKSIGSGIKTLFTAIGDGFKALGNAIKSLASPTVLAGVLVAGLITVIILGLAYAFKLVLEALTPFVKIILDAGTNSLVAALGFGIMALSLYGLATALGTLGTVGAVGLGVLAALVVAALAFGASFLMIGQGMAMAKEGFDAITNFEISKLESIRNVMKQMAEYMERVATSSAAMSIALMNPLMMPIMAAAAATAPSTNLTAGMPAAVTTKGSAAGESIMTANITIEMPITLDGKVLDKKIVSKVVQLKQNGNEMSNTFGSTTTANGFTTNN
jgi:hypothetical protein